MDKGLDKVVLLCDSRLRRSLAMMLSRAVPPLRVVAYDEIELGTEIEPVEVVSMRVGGNGLVERVPTSRELVGAGR
jgi:flagellar biosynthesis component FlhA